MSNDFFGPPSSGATTVHDVAASRMPWIAAAVQGDDLDLAMALVGNRPVAGMDAVAVRARLLLLLGRPADALALLSAEATLPAEGRPGSSWRELLALAARAATGEEAAYRGLLSRAQEASGSGPSWEVAYLVGAAAEQFGDHATAQGAWAQLVIEHGIHTRLTVAHFTAGEIRARDRQDSAQALRTVMANAGNFDAWFHDRQPDPSPALLTVQLLTDSGDVAGGRLLLKALQARFPADPQVTAAVDAHERSEPMRRHRRRAAWSCLLAVPLLPLGLLSLIALWVGRRVWERRVALPGLSLVDSRVWRAFRAVRFDPLRQRAASRGEINGKNVLGAVLGFCGGLAVGAGLVQLLGAAIGTDDPSNAVVAVMISIVLGSLVGGVIAGASASTRLQLHLLDRRRAAGHAQRLRRLREEAKACRCWQAQRLQGLPGREYQRQHLLARGDMQDQLPRLEAAWKPTGLAECPVTGALWLSVLSASSDRLVLLRGASPRPIEEPGPDVGFYL